MTNIWEIAEEQSRLDIRTFTEVIKSKLELFYKTTGEDITINLNEYGTHGIPTVTYAQGNHLSCSIQQDVKTVSVGYQSACNDTIKSM
jgi:hypothetical protein